MAKSLPTASDLIAEAWKTGLRHWPTYLEFTACFLILGIMQWGVSLFARQAATTGAWLAVMTVGGLIVAVLVAFVTVALIINVAEGLDGDAVPIMHAFGRARGRYLPFLMVSVLVFLAMVGGLLLLIAGLLVLFLLYRFAGYAVILEGARPWSSLGESRTLFQGRFWAVAWRLTATYVYFFAVSNLLSVVCFAAAGAYQGDLGLYFGPVSSWSVMTAPQLFVMTVVPAFASAFTLPLFTASDLRLWRELK